MSCGAKLSQTLRLRHAGDFVLVGSQEVRTKLFKTLNGMTTTIQSWWAVGGPSDPRDHCSFWQTCEPVLCSLDNMNYE